MIGALTSLSPSGESAWQELEAHLAWSDRPWIGWIFTGHTASALELLRRMQAAWSDRDNEVRTPDQPGELLAAIPWLVDERQGRSGFAALHVRHLGAAWAQAWDALHLRLNSLRERVRREGRGGVLLIAHPDWKPRVRDAAPDLYSVASFVFDVEPPPSEEAPALIGLGPLSGWAFVPFPRPGSEDQIRLLEQDIARQPERAAELALSLGRALFAAGRFSEALARVEAMEEPAALELRGLALAHQGQRDAALSVLRAAFAVELGTLSDEGASTLHNLLCADASPLEAVDMAERWVKALQARLQRPGALLEDQVALAQARLALSRAQLLQNAPQLAVDAARAAEADLEALHRLNPHLHTLRGHLGAARLRLAEASNHLGDTVRALATAEQGLEELREAGADWTAVELACGCLVIQLLLGMGEAQAARAQGDKVLARLLALDGEPAPPRGLSPASIGALFGQIAAAQSAAGDLRQALNLYAHAQAQFVTRPLQRPEQASYAALLASFASALFDAGDREQAMALAEESLRHFQALPAEEVDKRAARRAQGRCLLQLSRMKIELGDAPLGKELSKIGVRLFEQLRRDGASVQTELLVAMARLAHAEREVGNAPAALRLADQILSEMGPLARDNPAELALHADILTTRANALLDLRGPSAALPALEAARAAWVSVVGSGRGRAEWLFSLSQVEVQLSSAQSSSGRSEEAIRLAEMALLHSHELKALYPSRAHGRSLAITRSHIALGVGQLELGRVAAARKTLEDALLQNREMEQAEGETPHGLHQRSNILRLLGRAEAKGGDTLQARRHLQEAADTSRYLILRYPGFLAGRRELDMALMEQAAILQGAGDTAGERTILREATEVLRADPTPEGKRSLAQVLHRRISLEVAAQEPGLRQEALSLLNDLERQGLSRPEDRDLHRTLSEPPAPGPGRAARRARRSG